MSRHAAPHQVDRPVDDSNRPPTGGVGLPGADGVLPADEVGAPTTFDDEFDHETTSPDAMRALRHHLHGAPVRTTQAEIPANRLPEDTAPKIATPASVLLYVGAFLGGLALGGVALWAMAPRPANASDVTSELGRVVVAAAPLPVPRPSASVLVAEGYALVDADPVAAADRFASALELDPSDAAAVLGLGEARLTQGRTADALPYLCAAAERAGAIGASARGLLDANALSCLP